MRFERIRSRIFLAVGLSGAIGSLPACGSSKAKPDASGSDIRDAKPDVAGDGPTIDSPVTIRRPFLIGASLRSSTAAVRDDWSLAENHPLDSTLDPKTRRALAEAWEKDALEEHASIAAFSRFALHLLSVGAPPEMIVAAHRAALDEIRHARAAFALARRYGDRDVGPAPLRVDDALGSLALADIAELTAEEGCVGETLGAILAAEQATLATDPIVQRMLRRLAEDEARHAELAWQFVRWAVGVGGRDVVTAIQRGIRRAAAGTLAAPRRVYDVDLASWHAHGRVTCDEAHAIAVAGIDLVIDPASRALEAAISVDRKRTPAIDRDRSLATS